VLAWEPAAQFGIGGDGQLPLLAGGLLPLLPVGHDGGEDGLAFGVSVMHGLVTGRQGLLLAGCFGLAPLAGGAGFGVGADGGQAGLGGAEPDLAQFLTSPLRCPGGFDGVGVPQVQQRPVRLAADVRPVDGTERRQRLVPGGPDVRGGADGFGPDRVGGVGVAR
jgi:hypothetical protein